MKNGNIKEIKKMLIDDFKSTFVIVLMVIILSFALYHIFVIKELKPSGRWETKCGDICREEKIKTDDCANWIDVTHCEEHEKEIVEGNKFCYITFDKFLLVFNTSENYLENITIGDPKIYKEGDRVQITIGEELPDVKRVECPKICSKWVEKRYCYEWWYETKTICKEECYQILVRDTDD